jgi:acetyl esterase/lipase
MPSEDSSVLERSARPPDATWAYGGRPEQVADVYAGASGQPPRATVVVIHGGFWRPVYDRAHVRPLAAALADDGYLVVSLEYRRVPGMPDDTIADLEQALAALPPLLTDHAAHGVPVIVVGHSAGGHLALLLSADEALGLPCLALAPVADLATAERRDLGSGAVAAFLGESAGDRPDLDPAQDAAPRHPVTVLHGADDSIVPAAISASYAAAHPGAVRMVVAPDCAHFELIDPLSPVWPLVQTELARLVLNERREP